MKIIILTGLTTIASGKLTALIAHNGSFLTIGQGAMFPWVLVEF